MDEGGRGRQDSEGLTAIVRDGTLIPNALHRTPTRIRQPGNLSLRKFAPPGESFEPGAVLARLTIKPRVDGHERATDCTVIRIGSGWIVHVHLGFERVRLLGQPIALAPARSGS
jgi:hypothetical protein